MAYYKSASLLPCILSHILTDVFAVFSDSGAPELLNVIAHAVIPVPAIAYSVYLIKRVKTPFINNVGMRGDELQAIEE